MAVSTSSAVWMDITGGRQLSLCPMSLPQQSSGPPYAPWMIRRTGRTLFLLLLLGTRSSLYSHLDYSTVEMVFLATVRHLPGQIISLTLPVAVEGLTNIVHRLRGEVTTAKEPPPVTTALRRLDLSTLGQQIANLSPLLLSDPSTAAATAAAATAAATLGGGGLSSDASAQSSGVGVGASTPLRVNMLNDLIQQMVSLKHTPSSSVSLVGAGNVTATDDGPNNAGVIGSSSTTRSHPSLSAGERKQLELTITSALTRAQRLLDNGATRKALGGTYIYQTDWLSSKPKSDMPFAHVHVDLMGPLSTSPGCNYLLTAVDRFARWSFATPIPNVAADTVPRAFLQHWISHCAVPTTITID
ncbi:hypothetical protein SprV_0301366200 [Sparganum proliferum]